MLWVGKNKPSTMNWLVENVNCICKCIPIGAPGLMRQEGRNASENKTTMQTEVRLTFFRHTFHKIKQIMYIRYNKKKIIIISKIKKLQYKLYYRNIIYTCNKLTH